jgi:general stress protein YciG
LQEFSKYFSLKNPRYIDPQKKKNFENLSSMTKNLNFYIQNRIQKTLLRIGTTENYINLCVELNVSQLNEPDRIFEKHHRIPRFAGGSDEPNNIVLLTPRQHVLTHLLRYLEFGDKNDFLAYVFRKATSTVDLSSHGKRMAYLNKQNRQTFLDPNFQSEQGKKGGMKSGSLNTLLQQQARRKVGTKWGPIVGRSNQSDDFKSRLSQWMLFFHSETGTEIVVPPQRSAAEIFQYLHKEADRLERAHIFPQELVERAKKGGSMYNLIRGKRKQIYGWSIVAFFSLETD